MVNVLGQSYVSNQYFTYLFITGKSHEYEEALQSIEADKDIPDGLEVNESGSQAGDPGQTHYDSQSQI